MLFLQPVFAQVAELVDALVSGTSSRKGVQVRFLFWAPTYLKAFVKQHFTKAFFLGDGKGDGLPQKQKPRIAPRFYDYS